MPNKNILNLSGTPLVAYSILQSQSVEYIDKHFVSTDSKEIASIAECYGAEVINRPLELATDQSPEWLSWQHAINHVRKIYGDFNRFISLPATSPLRSKEDINNCLSVPLKENQIVITYTTAHRNPWFNLLRRSDRDPSIFQPVCNSSSSFSRRQDAPSCYYMTTVAYVCHPDSIMNNDNLFDLEFLGVFVPTERAIDIDTQLDFQLAEAIYNNLNNK